MKYFTGRKIVYNEENSSDSVTDGYGEIRSRSRHTETRAKTGLDRSTVQLLRKETVFNRIAFHCRGANQLSDECARGSDAGSDEYAEG